MPKIGEVRRDYEIGKGHKSNKWAWIGCSECGKERWVQLVSSKPINERCTSCVSSAHRHSPETRRKISEALLRERSPRWKGGTFVSRGYVMVYKPEHPRASKWGYIKRAILVLEEKLGRTIADGCDAHHINGIKSDDRPENLQEINHKTHGILNFRFNRNEDALIVRGK